MRYAIITYGSRGDVQPYIALALGLMDRGHEVTLLAPENFKDFAAGYGVSFYPLYGNLEELIYSPEAVRLLKTGNTISFLRLMQKASLDIQPQVNLDMQRGSANADVLISNILLARWVRSIAEKANKKWGIVQVSLPTAPTREFPFAGLAFFDNPVYNLFTYRLIEFFYWQFNKKAVNAFRKSLGLIPWKTSSSGDESTFNIYAISSQWRTRPKDWDSRIQITGHLSLPPDKRATHLMDKAPDGLTAWLQSGEKPIYVGFGSIPIPDAEKFFKILNNILDETNLRIVFCQGWSVISGLPAHPNLFVVKHVNHEWLFPQCKMAVIHGGAGTVATVLKAKIPVIVISVFVDQPWWGKIIQDKKLGMHIPFKKLTQIRLLSAIEAGFTSEIIQNANDIGEKINQEDGLKQALTIIEN
jgi:sterol 3beta-glucosyltransferase